MLYQSAAVICPSFQDIGHPAAAASSTAAAGCPGYRALVVKVKEGKEGYKQFVNFTSPLREITYYMGSHSVTCHPAEVIFSPLPQPKLVLDLVTPKGCKAELTWVMVTSPR